MENLPSQHRYIVWTVGGERAKSNCFEQGTDGGRKKGRGVRGMTTINFFFCRKIGEFCKLPQSCKKKKRLSMGKVKRFCPIKGNLAIKKNCTEYGKTRWGFFVVEMEMGKQGWFPTRDDFEAFFVPIFFLLGEGERMIISNVGDSSPLSHLPERQFRFSSFQIQRWSLRAYKSEGGRKKWEGSSGGVFWAGFDPMCGKNFHFRRLLREQGTHSVHLQRRPTQYTQNQGCHARKCLLKTARH